MRLREITLPNIEGCIFEKEESEEFQNVWEELGNKISEHEANDPIEKELAGWIEKRDSYGLAVLWNFYEDICKKCLDYENRSDRVKEFFEKLRLPIR